MSKKVGTFAIGDLFQANNTLAVDFPGGIDEVARIIAQDNANFGAQVTEMLNEFCETSTERSAVASGSIGGDMMEVDEFSQGPTQKDQPGYLIYFPLRKFQFAVGWTRQWEKKAKAADYAVRNQAAQGAS